jgi:hypothetical protein
MLKPRRMDRLWNETPEVVAGIHYLSDKSKNNKTIISSHATVPISSLPPSPLVAAVDNNFNRDGRVVETRL